MRMMRIGQFTENNEPQRCSKRKYMENGKEFSIEVNQIGWKKDNGKIS